MKSEKRQAVIAEIVKVMVAAKARGEKEMDAAKAAFPGTPDTVLWEAWCDLDMAETEAWWESVERTIDGELVRRAIASAHEGGG
jgi:hypothetical protein